MMISTRSSVTLTVDLNLFELPVVQVAAYTLMPRIEFDLGEPRDGRMDVTLWPLEEAGLGTNDALELFRRELTAAAFQRQAHRDYKEIRVLFAIAAYSPGIPGSDVVDRLQQTVHTLEAGSSGQLAEAKSWFTCVGTEGARQIYHVAPVCSVQTVLRALSRLHDTGVVVVESYDSGTGSRFSVSLRDGVDLAWWEERLATWLIACQDGRHPAVYPPVHPLERSYIRSQGPVSSG